MTTAKPKAEFDEIDIHEKFNLFDAEHEFEASEFDFTEGARYQFEKDQQRIERLERALEKCKEQRNEYAIKYTLASKRANSFKDDEFELDAILQGTDGKEG